MTDPHKVVLFHHFRRFLAVAAERGIDVAPLKGAHLLTSVYPEGEDRGPMCDVDFLVRPEQWDETLFLLMEMGFRKKEERERERPLTKALLHEAALYLSVSSRSEILFEPHRYLVQPARLSIDYDLLWARSRPSNFDGAPCRRLCVEDHVLFSAVHLMSHLFCLPASWDRDLQLLFLNGRPDLELLANRAHEWHISRPMWLMCELFKASGKAPNLEMLCLRLSPPRFVREYLRYLVQDGAGFRFARAGIRTGQALLWPALFDSPLDTARFALYYANLRRRDIFSFTSVSN